MTSLDPADRAGSLRSLERAVLLAGLALVTVWTCFHQLGLDSLGDWDEATYAQIAREMRRSGQWMTPVWNGHLFYDKPPLVFWLMSASMSLLSSPELAVRLVPAICGVVTIALTVWLAREMFGDTAAVVAGLVLLVGSPNPYGNFVRLVREGMLDVPLTACTVWAVLLFFRGMREPRAWRWIGVPLGLAFMVKSFAAVTPAAVIAGSLLLLPRVGVRLSRDHWRSLGIAVLVAVTIASPWHLWQLVEHGRAFVYSYVVQNVIGKVVAPGPHQGGGRLFYLRVIARSLPGWSWTIVPAAAVMLWRFVVRRDARALVLLVWMIGPLALFFVAQAKLQWYILPIYPAIAIMVGTLVDALVPRAARVVLIGLIGAATVAWNVQALAPLGWTSDAKALGECVQTITRPDETVAFFDHEQFYQLNQRGFWNIRPAVRFYADRAMLALVDRTEVEQWLQRGGVWVWAETPGDDALADRMTRVGRHGWEVLLARSSAAVPLDARRVCGLVPR